MTQSEALSLALIYARRFVIELEINYIGIETLVYGILITDEYISSKIELTDLNTILSSLSADISNQNKQIRTSDSVPLTLQAERTIKFAGQYAREMGASQLDNKHILLAILSFENSIERIFGTRGLIFDIFLAALNEGSPFKIEIGRLKFNIKPSRTRYFSPVTKLFTSANGKNKIAQALLKEAHNLYSFRQYEYCRQLCAVVSDLVKENKLPVYLTICCYIKEKAYQQAIDTNNVNPCNDDRILAQLSYCYIKMAAYDNAIELLALTNTNTATVCNNRGFCLTFLGKYDEAITLFDRATCIDPNMQYAYNNKGYALLKTGHIAEAKEQIMHSLSLDKSNAYAYRNLALVYIEEGNKNEAHSAITKAGQYHYIEDYGDDIDKIIAAIRAM